MSQHDLPITRDEAEAIVEAVLALPETSRAHFYGSRFALRCCLVFGMDPSHFWQATKTEELGTKMPVEQVVAMLRTISGELDKFDNNTWRKITRGVLRKIVNDPSTSEGLKQLAKDTLESVEKQEEA